MKVACNNNNYLYAKSDYQPIKLHPALPPCQVEEQEQQSVHPGKGKVRFNIPREESRARDSIFVLPFGGNKRKIRLVSDGRGNWRFEKMQKRSEQRCDSKSRRR